MKRFTAGLLLCLALLAGAVTPAGAESVCGDISQDDEINSIDAAIVLQYVAGLNYPDAFLKGDVNVDHIVDALDVLLILQHDAGLIQLLGCP
jgi:hypothetical protein